MKRTDRVPRVNGSITSQGLKQAALTFGLEGNREPRQGWSRGASHPVLLAAAGGVEARAREQAGGAWARQGPGEMEKRGRLAGRQRA